MAEPAPNIIPDQGGVLDEWIERSQLASELNVSVDTLSRWQTERRGPPCIRLGRHILYRREAVRDWLRAQEDSAAGNIQ